MTQTFLLVLLAIAVSKVTSIPTNGDIRLVDGGDRASGRLEVYMNGAWGTICYDHRSTAVSGGQGAARAACRQLGFNDYIDVGNVTQQGVPPGTVDITLGNISCSLGDSLNDATQHILRCSYLTSTSSCTHGDDMAITCDSSSKYNSPYKSEVRLTGGDFPSNGVLEVYINGEWGTVCTDSFYSSEADTVCRQMGYTGSTDYSSTTDSSRRIWLSNVDCEGSQQCFSLCFNYPSYSYQPYCSSNQQSVVNCTFSDTVPRPSAGYGSLCVTYLDLLNHLVAIIVGTLVAVLVFLLLLVLIPVIVCCCCIPGCVLYGRERRRVVYETL